MKTLRREEGQVTVLTAVFIVGLLGMAGFVIDVGSWFRQQRVVQTTVDSAALAGAQALPGDTGTARTYATTFAAKNGGVDGATITFTSRYRPDDSITVIQDTPTEGMGPLTQLSEITKRTEVAGRLIIAKLTPPGVRLAPSGRGCPRVTVRGWPRNV